MCARAQPVRSLKDLSNWGPAVTLVRRPYRAPSNSFFSKPGDEAIGGDVPRLVNAEPYMFGTGAAVVEHPTS